MASAKHAKGSANAGDQASPYDAVRLHEYAQDFRQAAHQAVDWIADYLENARRYPVLPKIQPAT